MASLSCIDLISCAIYLYKEGVASFATRLLIREVFCFSFKVVRLIVPLLSKILLEHFEEIL